jgi:hypothetical protein
MLLLSKIYKNIINNYNYLKTNLWLNKNYKYLICFPVWYINRYFKYTSLKFLINTTCITYFVYENRYYLVDKLIMYKINIENYINNIYKKPDFQIKELWLYTDLKQKYNVINYFKYNNIVKINTQIIADIYKYINIKFLFNNDIRLKIEFYYKNQEYIIYYSLYKLIDDTNSIGSFYLPFPPYNEDILNKYRRNMIVPTYEYYTQNKIYSLFNIESKNIEYIKINNNIVTDKKITDYFNKIQTPFNDLGIAYWCPVKLLWALSENNIDLNNFENFELKFLNMYFDEEKYALLDHYIKLNKDNLNNLIISERMLDVLKLKEYEYYK